MKHCIPRIHYPGHRQHCATGARAAMEGTTNCPHHKLDGNGAALALAGMHFRRGDHGRWGNYMVKTLQRAGVWR